MADFLEVGIDSSGALRGAQTFERAANDISASASRVQKDVDAVQRKMRAFGSTSIKDPAFRAQLKNFDKEFDKALSNIDKQLTKLEGGSRKAAGGLDALDHSSRHVHSSMGQFIEQVAQGDIGGVLGEIAQQGGSAGAALIGLGLATIGVVAGIAVMTAKIIETVRETDLLAKNAKLSAAQIQGLQVVANLTGESVEDLAENYKKLGPEVARFESLVKASGAAIDDDLRKKAQDTSLAWEELKLSAMGALNTIADDGLPSVSGALRSLTQLVYDLGPAWESIGGAVAGFASFAKEQIDDVRRVVALLKGELFSSGQLAGSSGEIGVGDFLTRSPLSVAAQIAQQAKARSERAKDPFGTVGGAEDFGADSPAFPNVPNLKKDKRGSGAAEREAKALFDAQIRLEQAQARILLDTEKRRIEEQRALLSADYEDRLTRAREFFAEKILLQQQETRAEIALQEQLLEITRRQQAQAKKPSEKLAFQDDIANIQAAISRLSDEGALKITEIGRQGLKEQNEEAERARKVFTEYAAAVRELDLIYRELSEGSQATATERFKDQYKAIYDLFNLVSPGQRKELENLLGLIQGQQSARRDFDNAGKRFDNLQDSLALEEDKIARLVNERVISEERGLGLLTEARKKYRSALLEELDTQIALAQALPDSEGLIIQLERQKVAVEQLGFKFTELQEVLGQFGQNAKSILQDAFYQGIVEGPRAFFQTLLQGFAQLLAQMAAQLLASQVFKLLGNLGGSGGGGGGGFLGILGTIIGFAGSFAGSFGANASIANTGGTFGNVTALGLGQTLGRGFASGGTVTQSGFYRYGELGPEPVFMPNGTAYLPQGAYVQNNHQMRESAQAAAPPVVNINVYAQDAKSFASPQTRDQIARDYQLSIARANRNGGHSL